MRDETNTVNNSQRQTTLSDADINEHVPNTKLNTTISIPSASVDPTTNNSESDTMINHTVFQYAFIRFWIFFLHAIAPLSTAWTATLIGRAYLNSAWPRFTAFNIWCLAETAFFIFFLWYRRHLQREALHPPLRSREERKAIFDKVRGEVNDIEKFLQGWFRGAKVEEIGREQLKSWLDWAFWDGRAGPEDQEEMDGMVKDVESLIGKPLPEGTGTAKGLRLTLDPIEMEWRSLLWYACMLVVDTTTHLRMMRYGMQYHGTSATTWKVFPPRPLAAATNIKTSEAESLSYWVRPHTSKTRHPMLFIHGIGVGLYPYVEFFHELNMAQNSGRSDKDGEVGILIVEILQTSSRLTHDILTRNDFLKQITMILDANDYTRFTLVSHSYGSVLSTHILTHPPLASRVAATLLIDPVTVLLHMPDVAYNFTVKQPTTANEWQLWYFASKDPGVAHTLGRHFFWTENVLWREDIMKLIHQNGMKMTASLASRDLIVDTKSVGAYLMEGGLPDPVLVKDDTTGKHMELEIKGEKRQRQEEWKTRNWKGEGLEVLWWDNLDHAQVFDAKTRRARLVEVLVEYSRMS
ncbi:hypothetical protein LTR56_008679 [Elasticomyces elasticus]|nr:hypothetical protein LTR22_022513 [Elasticomyces elasticus]KAK3646328.1 hypothetical protein LTR56_008679 [Elasticomyces elasticus]KAK4911481.1 hypothetical protein LTR49_019976 [Elasticomyces elasticus]KAK5768048.1 hypothetical protein LTS12_001865 [Elasticomyces elasticus]